VDKDPDVGLRIGDNVYAVRLVPLDDPNVTAEVQAAYGAKYQLTDRTGEAPPDVRYWHVVAQPDASN
jgi:hypothetical protein